jgi:GNAT superfamily N-acetyltransferase
MSHFAVPGGQGAFQARPLTPATWPDLEHLFGLPGGSIVRGCWCMHYRLTGQAGCYAGAGSKLGLRDLVNGGVVPGLIGYLDGSPAGWISLGPREEYLRLRRSPIMKPVDGTKVWSVVCSYVARPYRGLGLQHRMLAAAIGFARDNGPGYWRPIPLIRPNAAMRTSCSSVHAACMSAPASGRSCGGHPPGWSCAGHCGPGVRPRTCSIPGRDTRQPPARPHHAASAAMRPDVLVLPLPVRGGQAA